MGVPWASRHADGLDGKVCRWRRLPEARGVCGFCKRLNKKLPQSEEARNDDVKVAAGTERKHSKQLKMPGLKRLGDGPRRESQLMRCCSFSNHAVGGRGRREKGERKIRRNERRAWKKQWKQESEAQIWLHVGVESTSARGR